MTKKVPEATKEALASAAQAAEATARADHPLVARAKLEMETPDQFTGEVDRAIDKAKASGVAPDAISQVLVAHALGYFRDHASDEAKATLPEIVELMGITTGSDADD